MNNPQYKYITTFLISLILLPAITRQACLGGAPNGVKQMGEPCDNGPQSGCSNLCTVVPGYQCQHVDNMGGSICLQVCGNGIRTISEQCDNGMQRGCNAGCYSQPGYTCTGSIGQASICTKCGNGFLQPGQQCDNGNAPGCSTGCRLDPGYICVGVGCAQIVQLVCGNGMIQQGQSCDDGNSISGDGCNARCVTQQGYVCLGNMGERSLCKKPPKIPTCGNNIYQEFNPDYYQYYNIDGLTGYNVDPQQYGKTQWGYNSFIAEKCDNGNKPGCIGCQISDGWSCINIPGQPSRCTPNLVTPPCGNGRYQPQYGQQCDDKNLNNNDGCDMNCRIENGWICPYYLQCYRSQEYQSANCGDGFVDTILGETCDDRNQLSGDGCSSRCRIQDGYVCEYVYGRSLCRSYANSFCGNGVVEPNEQCDNGWPVGVNGCSTQCRIKPGWDCYVIKYGGSSICHPKPAYFSQSAAPLDYPSNFRY